MRIQTLGAMLVLVWAPNLAAQIWPGRSVRRAGAGIEVLDSSAALPRRVFEDTGATVLMDPSVGPGGKWVALVRHIRIPTHDENGSDRRKTTVIVVDALTGRRQLEVPGGLYFFWCGTDCIAVLYGYYSEGFEGGPSSDSLDVFRPSNGLRSQSYKASSGQFVDPHWFPKDSSILSGGWSGSGREFRRTFLRLDLRTGEIDATEPLRGEISGSGRFAIERDYGEPARVVRNSESVSPPLEGRWQVEEWLGRTDKALLLSIPPRRPSPPGTPNRVRPSPPRDPTAPPTERTYRVWDVAGGTVSGEWMAAETPWRGPAPNGCRLFLKDGRLTAAPGCH